nr:hypothetical protein [Tanacetum cinerariifolium]
MPDSQGERAIQRDLSLTWAADLPAGNRITEGAWWNGETPGAADAIPGVSVEGEVARSLTLKLG